MKLLKELFKKYQKQGFVSLIMIIAVTLLGLLSVDLSRRIINVLTSGKTGDKGSYQFLLIYCALMLVAILSRGLMGHLTALLHARISQSVLSEIRLKLFNHILRLPQQFHDKNPVGLLMSRIIDDVAFIGRYFTQVFLQPIVDIFIVIFYSAYIFFLNPKLAIVAVITIPCVVIILPRFNRRLDQLSKEYSRSMGDISNFLQETFSGISDIRSSQTYFFEESKLKARIKEFVTINLNLVKTSSHLHFLMRAITEFVPLLVYLYGGMLCLRGELNVGALVAFIAVVSRLYDPVDSFVTFIELWRQVKVRFEKLDEYLSLRPETEILPDNGQKRAPLGNILFDNIQFGFNEREMLLKDVKFNVTEGAHVGFVGTSGSGKSLTTSLLSKIYNPLSGKIILGDKNIDQLHLYDLRSQIGYVSQTPFLFNDTIKKNILYALLRRKGTDINRMQEWIDFSALDDISTIEKLDREIIEAVRQVGLFDDIYELGLKEKLDEAVFEIKDEDKRKLIQARKIFFKEMQNNCQHYIEYYREQQFLEQCSLFENIVFCPASSIIDNFGSIKQFCKYHLNEQVKANGLLEKLLKIGVNLSRQDIFLLEQLYKKDSVLLTHLDLSKKQIESKVRINEKMALREEGSIRIDQVDSGLAEDILELAYNYIPAKSQENLLDDTTKNSILESRKLLRENVSQAKLKQKIRFFNAEEYMGSLSVRENIIFGNIDPLRKKANEAINDLIRKIIREAGIEELVLKIGLESNAGERGNKLSGGQKQKVAIARILLKNPSVLILDEATASLDAISQGRITDLVREKFKDKTVISIAHRLSTIKDYDKILVFDKGQIVEEGTFEELIKRNGMFNKLFCESN